MPKELDYTVVGIMASDGHVWSHFSKGKNAVEAAENAVKDLVQTWGRSFPEDEFLVVEVFRGTRSGWLLHGYPTPISRLRSELKQMYPQLYR